MSWTETQFRNFTVFACKIGKIYSLGLKLRGFINENFIGVKTESSGLSFTDAGCPCKRFKAHIFQKVPVLTSPQQRTPYCVRGRQEGTFAICEHSRVSPSRGWYRICSLVASLRTSQGRAILKILHIYLDENNPSKQSKG